MGPLINAWDVDQWAETHHSPADVSAEAYFGVLTSIKSSLTTSPVTVSFLPLVTLKPGSSATWFRAGPQCTRTRRGMRKLVGLQRHKSSFLVRPCLFLWARTEGCHGDEVGLSPTAWSGKSSSLLWHLPRLGETETIEGRNTGKQASKHTRTHTRAQTHTRRGGEKWERLPR